MSDCGPGFVLAELVQISRVFANVGAVSLVGGSQFAQRIRSRVSVTAERLYWWSWTNSEDWQRFYQSPNFSYEEYIHVKGKLSAATAHFQESCRIANEDELWRDFVAYSHLDQAHSAAVISSNSPFVFRFLKLKLFQGAACKTGRPVES